MIGGIAKAVCGKSLKQNGASSMKVRFSSFIGTREVSKVEGGYTTRVDFELPHRVMLLNLSRDELFNLSEQCEELLSNPLQTPTVYLGTVDSIEEVSNKLEV